MQENNSHHLNNFAVVFPGQGSQQLGMLSDLYQSNQLVQELFVTASEILDYDLWALIKNGPIEQLNQTTYTQPALLTASIAVWNVFKQNSSKLPKILAGHSLGEYSALVASGSLDFNDALRLVAARGRFMQEALPVGEGAMAAVLGMDDDVIKQNLSSGVEIANYNSVGQTVIAGRVQNVLTSIEQLKSAGAKLVKLLDVSVPSHCSLMQPAVEKFNLLLDDVNFSKPLIPVIHNYSVASYNSPDEIKAALAKQLINPVRWVEVINSIAAMDIDVIYEFGPGDVLSKLCKRINKDITAVAVHSLPEIEEICG